MFRLPLTVYIVAFRLVCLADLSNINAIVRRSPQSDSKKLYSKNLTDLQDYAHITLFNTTVEVLEEGAIADFKQLQLLSVSAVQLKVLKPNCFRQLPALKSLYLSLNGLEEIQKNIFNHLNLNELYLSENNIKKINESAFDDLPNLKLIDLSRNEIGAINPEWFERSPNVDELFLRDNLIEEIPENSFRNVRNVSYIDLSGNDIRIIHGLSFHGLENLSKLDLSKNSIKEIPNGALEGLKKLNILLLIENKIECLSDDVLGSLENVTAVNLLLNNLGERCLERIRDFRKSHPRVYIFY